MKQRFKTLLKELLVIIIVLWLIIVIYPVHFIVYLCFNYSILDYVINFIDGLIYDL